MSEIRLVMLEKDSASSGRVPSSAISSILWAISQGAKDISSFWKKVGTIDQGLHDYYQECRDPSPMLEGSGDGLLVISWHYHCIESFQEYQPVRLEGQVQFHNGMHVVDEEQVPFAITGKWHVIDHHFEESRH